jgi:hypothetical protein
VENFVEGADSHLSTDRCVSRAALVLSAAILNPASDGLWITGLAPLGLNINRLRRESKGARNGA